MSIFSKLFYKDTTSVQTTVNEDAEGVGGEEIVISDTDNTTKEK